MPYRNALLILIALIAATTGGYYSRKPVPPEKPVATAQAPVAPKERKVLYWYDPMTPASHFDKPGKSPFMDMDLVPKYADEETGATGGVAVDSRTVQNLGVRTATVETGTLAKRIDTVGYVRPDEHRIEVVQPRAAGWVEKLHVRAVNDPVRRGQLLLELYAPDILAAQEEYLLTLKAAQRDPADRTLEQAAMRRLSLLGLSEEQIRTLATSGKTNRRVAVYATSDGVVSELGVREGMAVTPSTPMFSLLDLSSVWITAEVTETQASWVAPGAAVEIDVPALPGRVLKGQVEFIYPQLNGTTRTLQVRVRLPNPGLKLKPGMYARVSIRAAQGQQAVLVPTEAVISTGTRSVVIVAEGSGRFSPIDVKIGSEANGKTEILEGLAPGQTVVISGQFLIDSEASLRGTLARLQGAGDKP
jgi:Cu(I)/Ag(I) efflux system membrane fusion protein